MATDELHMLKVTDHQIAGEFFEVSFLENGLVTCIFDDKKEKVNKLSKSALLELDAILGHLSVRNEIKLFLFKSGKSDNFIAGADINEIRGITTEEDAKEKAGAGQAIIHKISKLNFKKVVAINGACVGGGLELALAFDVRIVSDHKKTQLGLPEVQLGIIPGFGGTQRLPRLIGLPKGLPLVLSGKLIPADKAYKLGIADFILAQEFFDHHVDQIMKELIDSERVKSFKKSVRRATMDDLLSSPLIRNIVFSKAKKETLKKTKGQYPAILKALEVIKEGYPLSIEEGLSVELRGFSEVASTKVCKNLIQLFFTNESLKKEKGNDSNLEVVSRVDLIKKTGVLGAGIMGGGIAWLLSNKNYFTRLKDISWEAIGLGYKSCKDVYRQLLKIRKLTQREVKMKMGHISGTIDYTGFHDLDYVIEAIVENIEIKKSVFKELESFVPEHTIIASNTSALSISEMADAFEKPGRFIGVHFFNPVNRMPLVEVIPGDGTSAETIATTVEFVQKLGKTPIVVKDVPGFLVNRILIPYVNEAVYLLEQGATIEMVDKLLLDFGMPMGPFELADNVGLDVGYKVAKHLENSYGSRMQAPGLLELVHKQDGLLGKKSGKGFYIHKGKDKSINHGMLKLLHQFQSDHEIKPKEFDAETIINRCLLAMINESAKCLEEGVVGKAEYLDMALIMGTGFPPFRGGALRQADEWGLTEIFEKLEKFKVDEGVRFEPAKIIKDKADSNNLFYSI